MNGYQSKLRLSTLWVKVITNKNKNHAGTYLWFKHYVRNEIKQMIKIFQKSLEMLNLDFFNHSNGSKTLSKLLVNNPYLSLDQRATGFIASTSAISQQYHILR